MGCKSCKVKQYDEEEGIEKKKRRRTKRRKRHRKRSRHRHRRKHKTVDIRKLPPDDAFNAEYEMKTVLHTNDDTVNKNSTVGDELIDIEVTDPEAFNQVFIQQRQKALDNTSYRSTIESWKPSSLQQLAETIEEFSKGKSLVDRHWIIFYWIAYNIEYDTVSYFAKDYKDQSAEGVFRTKKGVCAGYANIYKHLCDQLQMPCEVVNGYSKGYGFDDREDAPPETNHAWNAVEIDHHWYLMESTWGAGHLNKEKAFERELNDYYFLPRSIEMIYHHLPQDEKSQLLRTSIKISQFMQMPKLRPDYFEFNLEMIQPRNQYFVKLEQDKPFALVIMKAPSDVHLIADLKLHDEKIDGGHRVIFNRKKRYYYCYFAPSNIGEYKITIYAKRGGTAIGTFNSVLDLTLNITQVPVNPISYPKTWEWFFDFELKILSPLRTHLINLTNNERFAQILIRTPSNILLIGELKNYNNEPVICGNRVYYDGQKDFWRCKFAPNENGIFDAIILAKKKSDVGNYTSVVSFKIIANQVLSPPLSFPNTWQLFYDLDLRILYPVGRGIIVLHDKPAYAEIRIKAPDDVSLVSQFQNDRNEEISDGKQIYYDHEKDFWRCKFAPNRIGIFEAMILAKKKSDPGSFASVARFIIELKQLSGQPVSFLNTTQLYHDFNLKVLSPLGYNKIILSKKSSFLEICLKTPSDVVLFGQLMDSNKERIPDANQVYYDRNKDIWRCKFAPNRNGLFDAIIMAKKKSDSSLFSTAVVFQIEANYIHTPPVTFPQTWQLFYDFNLKIEAPRNLSNAIWSENASYAEILIQTPDDIQLSCQIEYNGVQIENGSLAQYNHEKQHWQLLFAPERIGLHELIIYAKRIHDIESLSSAVVKFNLDVTKLRQSMKFPMIYTQFETTKCQINTPLNGILKKDSIIPFHCIIPGAISIQLTVDSKRLRSEGYEDPIFQREIAVGSEEITIYAKYDQNPHCISLIKYSVE